MTVIRGVFLLGLLTIRVHGAAAELIPADPESGFNFPYILVLPEERPTNPASFLVVETNNTGPKDHFTETIAATLEEATGRGLGPMLSRHMEQPFLMPVFPRTRTDGNLYTHALDRDSLLLREGPLKRIDRQLLAMVEDAGRRLSGQGMEIRSRFVMVGFSASGSFANRFAFLHPEKLLAVVAGGINAFPMLPAESSGEDRLPFPVGVGDMEALTGRTFNRETWAKLPQMIFMGAQDTNDAVRYDDAYSAAARALIFRELGEPMHDRWLKAQAFYLEAEAMTTFITYPHLGHWIDRRVGMDIVHFIQSVTGEDEPVPHQ
jgi:dienelactone hydrolase